MGCNVRIVFVVLAIIGVVLIVVAAVLGFAVLPGVIDDQIDENVILDSNDTEQYERFEKLPFALNFSVSFFHVNNPSGVMAGMKPQLTEIGPIIYAKQLEKINIVFKNDDGTIEYNNIKTHMFLEEFSRFKETDEVTVINTPLVSVMQIFENYAEMLSGVLSGMIGDYLLDLINRGYPTAFNMNPKSVFHTIKIEEYTFKGYKFCDPTKTKGAAKALCALIRLKSPPTIEEQPDRILSFSFFKQKEGLDPNTYEVEQGVNDIQRLGQIVKYGGKDRTDWWKPGGKCNQVTGTDSTIFGPHNDKKSEFTILESDICRTVELEFTDEIEYEGIPGYRSTLKRSNMDWSLEENDCYLIQETKDIDGNNKPLPNYFTDMSKCLEAPIVLSLPHFLWAEEKNYIESVEGLNPVEDDHKIYVDMEPNTGSPMVGHKRVQFNTILRNYGEKIDVLEGVRNAIVPILWVDEHVNIPENLVDLIKDQYLTPVTAIEICKYVFIGVGTTMTLVFGGLYFYKRRKSS